ncbi:capsular polysaccharide export protein [Sphingomonas gellani]|uniref:Capsular polysaccharide export protein n=1 Tax=Sphingomonas gellani TaxID=1166340 RepID=A0A1H8I911_9SPHN|nr:capsular biosynthesis protein [Sphingomonas gellani]SEN64667.1 capsular polysaccharide export protein [Sphingomonas gellani]
MPDLFAGSPVSSRPAPRRILMLQGLMGRLFRRLGQALRQEGHQVYKVNFNGGDRLFWRLPGGIDYRDSLENWPAAMGRIVRERGITDVMLFGDCRPLHMAAIDTCRELGVPVHVFEEGYIRPDWVTFEAGGVNGHSSLSRDPEWYRAEAAMLPPLAEHRQIPSSFRRRALEAVAYNVADVFTRWRYPYWRNHRPWPPMVEAAGWVRRLRRRKEAEAQSLALVSRLERSCEPYMLFPLQLDSDAQIRLHSSFAGVADALRMVIRSFADHAPAPLRLVVKEHPLDNGVRDWRAETAALAALHGVADRVDYLESGDIVPVARNARGMVTINSTSGTLALALGVPVVVLGQAVYDIDDVTFQGRLDDFWQDPGRPHEATFAAFRRVLIDRCLVPGGFFSEEALAQVTQGVVVRLRETRAAG